LIWPKQWPELVDRVDPDLLAEQWRQGIAGLTGDQIKAGIEHCIKHRPFPPTIADFRADCHRGMNAEQRAFAARAAQPPPRLPRETWAETRERGRRHLQHIKSVLGNSSVNPKPPEA